MFQGRPVIGLSQLYDGQRDSYWMLPGYMQSLESQGAVVMMLPLTDDAQVLDYFLGSCDGFVLTGGHDVAPALYGREQTPLCAEVCPLRDRMDAYLLRGAVARDKAVLGICRGHQLMNAVFGGTLYQDHPTEHPSAVCHRMQPPYDAEAHAVTLSGPLAQLLGKTRWGVNSCHHQAVEQLSEAFIPMAVADDGLVEAIYMPDRRFVWGVQWHPEFAWKVSGENRKILGAFLKAAEGK